MFSRGNKIIVTGIRRENEFLAKKYSRTPYHLVEKIETINEDGTVVIRSERVGEQEQKYIYRFKSEVINKMAIIGLYDADMSTYIHVPFN